MSLLTLVPVYIRPKDEDPSGETQPESWVSSGADAGFMAAAAAAGTHDGVIAARAAVLASPPTAPQVARWFAQAAHARDLLSIAPVALLPAEFFERIGIPGRSLSMRRHEPLIRAYFDAFAHAATAVKLERAAATLHH